MVGKGIASGKHRRMPGYIRQADGTVADQAVFRRHHKIQRVVPHPGGAYQVVGLWRQGDHCDFRTAVEDFFVGHF